eukprot:INCI7782.1.p1 GENE.INCI7782.1~~INCI7782.1.p1  ORF type:complete len:868 (-),score=113.17 INCI7782.1:159-2762(-)
MHPVLSSSAAVYLQSLGPLRSHPAASSVPPPAFRVWAAVTRWRLAAALALLSYARPRWVAGAVDLLWSDGLSPMLEAAGAPRAAAVVWEQLKDGMLWLLEVLIKTRAGQRLVARLRRSIQHRIAKLHEFAENKAKTATQKVLDHLRTTLKDPDMPGFVLEAIDETIDMISPDVSEEVVRKTNEFILYYRSFSRLQRFSSPHKWVRRLAAILAPPPTPRPRRRSRRKRAVHLPDRNTHLKRLQQANAAERRQILRRGHSRLQQEKEGQSERRRRGADGSRKMAGLALEGFGAQRDTYLDGGTKHSSTGGVAIVASPRLQGRPMSQTDKHCTPLGFSAPSPSRDDSVSEHTPQHPACHGSMNLRPLSVKRQLFASSSTSPTREASSSLPWWRRLGQLGKKCTCTLARALDRACGTKFYRSVAADEPAQILTLPATVGQQRASAYYCGRRWSTAIQMVRAAEARLWRCRAWILYTLSPYDRSFWNCIRDPAWVGMNCIGLVPRLGVLWWLFLFIIRDNNDEHQVAEFIVSFQTARFVMQGCWGNVRGTVGLLWCVYQDASCAERGGGPAVELFDILLFLLQLMLVTATSYKLFQATRMSYAALPVGLSAQTHNAGLERSGLAQSNCLRPHTEVDANTSRITKREGKEAGRPSSCPIEAFNTPQKQVVSAEAGIDQESTADSRRRRERNAVGAFWDWARGLASPPTAVHPERPSAHLQLRHGSKLLSSAARVPLRPAVGAEGRLIERGPGNRGGHLFKLFLYDVFVLLLVFALVGLTLLVGPDDCVSSPTEIQAAVKVGACSGAADGGEWRLWSQLYWIRVLSGYLAFPFVIFKIPGLNKLLMHTSRTGYNKLGQTVPALKMFTPPVMRAS